MTSAIYRIPNTYTFDHDLWLKTLAPNAPLRYRVPAYCLNCEDPIMPPAANNGIKFCVECRQSPEYRNLVGLPNAD